MGGAGIHTPCTRLPPSGQPPAVAITSGCTAERAPPSSPGVPGLLPHRFYLIRPSPLWSCAESASLSTKGKSIPHELWVCSAKHRAPGSLTGGELALSCAALIEQTPGSDRHKSLTWMLGEVPSSVDVALGTPQRGHLGKTVGSVRLSANLCHRIAWWLASPIRLPSLLLLSGCMCLVSLT